MIKFLMVVILIPILALIDIWLYFVRLYEFASKGYDRYFKDKEIKK